MQIEFAINSFVCNAISDLKRAVEAHISEYGAEVNKMVAQHQEKAKHLSQEIQETNSDNTELSERKQILETLQSRLFQV